MAHGLASDWREYDNTHVAIDGERAIRRATQLDAFLRGVRYKRYDG